MSACDSCDCYQDTPLPVYGPDTRPPAQCSACGGVEFDYLGIEPVAIMHRYACQQCGTETNGAHAQEVGE
jgi:hypothetical protein